MKAIKEKEKEKEMEKAKEKEKERERKALALEKAKKRKQQEEEEERAEKAKKKKHQQPQQAEEEEEEEEEEPADEAEENESSTKPTSGSKRKARLSPAKSQPASKKTSNSQVCFTLCTCSLMARFLSRVHSKFPHLHFRPWGFFRLLMIDMREIATQRGKTKLKLCFHPSPLPIFIYFNNFIYIINKNLSLGYLNTKLVN